MHDDEQVNCQQEENEEMKPESMRVLLTGGAGFIGSHVAEALLRRGNYVIIVDEMNDYYDLRLKRYNISILKSSYSADKLVVYNSDICDANAMSLIFESEGPTHIIHLAARAGVRPSIKEPSLYVRTNVEGTSCLLDLAVKFEIQHFVYASSSSVYGGSDKELLNEEDNISHPVSPYAATKATCELLAFTFNHLYGLNTTGLRFFTVYGPRGRPDMAPFKFIDRIVRGMPIQQYGDGNTSRDYTYIGDIVDGVVRAVDRPLGNQVFNLGNGNPFLLSKFIRIVEKAVGRPAVIELLPNQPGDVERTCADIEKAKRLLGYQPSVTFEDGITRTVEWYKFFFSVIFPGGNVGGQIADVADPFNSLPPPIAGSTDSDIETDSNAFKATRQLRHRESRKFTTVEEDNEELRMRGRTVSA